MCNKKQDRMLRFSLVEILKNMADHGWKYGRPVENMGPDWKYSQPVENIADWLKIWQSEGGSVLRPNIPVSTHQYILHG